MTEPTIFAHAVHTGFERTQQAALDTFITTLSGRDTLSRDIRETFTRAPGQSSIETTPLELLPYLRSLYGRERTKKMSAHLSFPFAPPDLPITLQAIKSSGAEGAQLEFSVETSFNYFRETAKKNAIIQQYVSVSKKYNKNIQDIVIEQDDQKRLHHLWPEHHAFVRTIPPDRSRAQKQVIESEQDMSEGIHKYLLGVVRILHWGIIQPFTTTNEMKKQPSVLFGIADATEPLRLIAKKEFLLSATNYNQDPYIPRPELEEVTRHASRHGLQLLRKKIQREASTN